MLVRYSSSLSLSLSLFWFNYLYYKFVLIYLQTCIGVDYVLAVDGIEVPFLEAVKRTVCSFPRWLDILFHFSWFQIKQFYGENPKTSDAFARIINEHHVKRYSLWKLLLWVRHFWYRVQAYRTLQAGNSCSRRRERSKGEVCCSNCDDWW